MEMNGQLQRWSKIVALTALVGVIIASAGCADMMTTSVTAPGVAAYSMGDLGTVENASMGRTWAAVQTAVNKLELREYKTMKDGLEARLEAKSGTDRTVVFILRRLSDASTELHIRIGTFGDEAYARQVLDAVNAAL